MKITFGAPSIVAMAFFFLLAGCESIENVHVPNLFGRDEVPDEVKDQPRFVEIPMTEEEEKNWPRLGDVPFKPKDFTPPAAYNESMDELRQDRLEAEAARNGILFESSATENSGSQDKQGKPFIQPPLFLKK